MLFKGKQFHYSIPEFSGSYCTMSCFRILFINLPDAESEKNLEEFIEKFVRLEQIKLFLRDCSL